MQGFSCSVYVRSSWTRDQIHVLCIGRQILNSWTTREIQTLRRYYVCNRVGCVCMCVCVCVCVCVCIYLCVYSYQYKGNYLSCNSTKSTPYSLVQHRAILYFVSITTKDSPDLMSPLGSFVSSGSEQSDK